MRTFTKKEDYIFEIIHDLKAPILSMDFALKNIDRDEFLEEIYKINRHNLSYVENLMSAYALSKGRYCPKFETVDVVKILTEELSVLNFFIYEKKLRIILSTDKIENSCIACDKYLTRQIILNLLTNAVKYTPQNGTVRIVFERNGKNLSICFSNPYSKTIEHSCSSKMGLEIVRKKLRAVGGSFKITKSRDEICFNIFFKLNK